MFASLAMVLGLAALGGIAARLVKAPVILGYMAAGVLLAQFGWSRQPETQSLLLAMSQLGVTLLLFLVGLELPISDLKRVGKVALVSGIGQIAVVGILAFGLARGLGFNLPASAYVGIAMTFSSTIVIIRLLSEKGDLQSLHGKIVVGTLLVQDFVAIGILVAVSGISGNLAETLVKAVVVFGAALWLSNQLMPRLLGWLSQSTELLFIGTIGWCLAVTALVSSRWVGLSVEIGGLLAGLSLSAAVQEVQIAARIKPLRDFFLTLFFVALGSMVRIQNIGILWPALVLSMFVIIGSPLVMMWLLNLQGYAKRTAFLAGITMGQISEFSLVVVAAGVAAGWVSTQVLTTVTIVAMVTMTCGSYLINHGEKIYRKWGKWLLYFDRKHKAGGETKPEKLAGHIVLFGHNRIGSVLLPELQKLGRQVVVVDFNPEVVERLNKDGVRVVYGDAGDVDIYTELGISDADLIVSTVPDKNDNLTLLKAVRDGKQTVIVTAVNNEEARELYKAGADYVLIPHGVGGDFLAGWFSEHGLSTAYIAQRGKSHARRLEEAGE